MNAEKHFQRKDSEKNLWNSTKAFTAMRKIHCKIIHCKITFFNIFGHLALFPGLITRNSISDWYMDMLIHLPFRFHSSSYRSLFNFLFWGIVYRNKRLEHNRNICWFCFMMHCKSSSFHLFSFASSHLHIMFVTLHVFMRSQMNK